MKQAVRVAVLLGALGLGTPSPVRAGVDRARGQACDLSGSWFAQDDPTQRLNVTRTSATTFRAVPGAGVGWESAVLSLDPQRTQFVTGTFVSKSGNQSLPGVLDAVGCQVLDWANAGSAWCRDGNARCVVEPREFWRGSGQVHIVEVSHSDVFWLGDANDLLVDSQHIAGALDLMNQDPTFKWQHECVLFLRAFFAIFPDRSDELVERIREGRMDIGGTFTEPFEETLYNEILVRQMYFGRKWVVDTLPADVADITARVAFHQDGPLRALQMPQIYAKAGLRYLKGSRLSDHLFRWQSPDGSSLLTFEEYHYGEGPGDLGYTETPHPSNIVMRMNEWTDEYAGLGLPPVFACPLGGDYTAPQPLTDLQQQWASTVQQDHNISLTFSHFREFLASVDAAQGTSIPVVRGERPNLWWPEASPTHHWMFTHVRNAARKLPAAESWATFRALVEGTFENYPQASLNLAWQNVTLADHGLGHEKTPYNMNDTMPWLVNAASPPFADLIYREKWARASDTADELVRASQAWFAGQVGRAAPLRENATAPTQITVFNSLSWARSDVVVADLAHGNVALHRLATATLVARASGKEVAFQLVGNGSAIVFVAESVPAFGYKTFDLHEPAADQQQHRDPRTRSGQCQVGQPWDSTFESEFYAIAPGRGGVASMVDKATGEELFNTTHYMAGEWMSLVYTDNGASETHAYRHPSTTAYKNATFQHLGALDGWKGWTCAESGSVRSVFRSNEVQTAHSLVTLELVVYSGIKRVDVNVLLRNWNSTFGVANRVVFPIRTPLRNVSLSVPYGVVGVGVDEAEHGELDQWMDDPGADVPSFERGWDLRPREVQDWVAVEAASVGVTMASSVGSFDWVDASGAYPRESVVLGAEALMHTDSNQGPFLDESGDHAFSFSILARAPGWSGGWRYGVQANYPLDAVVTTNPPRGHPHTTTLPAEHNFLNTTGENMWVTVVKQGEKAGKGSGSVVVRAADFAGVRSSVRFDLSSDISGAAKTNIIEGHEHDLAPCGQATVDCFSPEGSVVLREVGSWSIETFQVLL